MSPLFFVRNSLNAYRQKNLLHNLKIKLLNLQKEKIKLIQNMTLFIIRFTIFLE